MPVAGQVAGQVAGLVAGLVVGQATVDRVVRRLWGVPALACCLILAMATAARAVGTGHGARIGVPRELVVPLLVVLVAGLVGAAAARATPARQRRGFDVRLLRAAGVRSFDVAAYRFLVHTPTARTYACLLPFGGFAGAGAGIRAGDAVRVHAARGPRSVMLARQVDRVQGLAGPVVVSLPARWPPELRRAVVLDRVVLAASALLLVGSAVGLLAGTG